MLHVFSTNWVKLVGKKTGNDTYLGTEGVCFSGPLQTANEYNYGILTFQRVPMQQSYQYNATIRWKMIDMTGEPCHASNEGRFGYNTLKFNSHHINVTANA
jgi:hypothetical protein